MREERPNPNEQQANYYPHQTSPNYYYPQSSPAYYPAYPYRQGLQHGQVPQQSQAPQPGQVKQQQSMQGMLPMEQSYIENILRLNRGKHVSVYMTFEQNEEWNAKVFKGEIEAAGRDHIILSDPDTGKRYLLLMIYLNYVTFDEEINYEYPYNNSGMMSNHSQR